jgi:hypothetical protein
VRKDYASFEELAGIIRFRYPRFSAAQAAFVAAAWGKLDDDGRVRLAGDPRHHWVNPVLYKREDAEACWRELRAPLLMLVGEESDHLEKLGADGTPAAFRRYFRTLNLPASRAQDTCCTSKDRIWWRLWSNRFGMHT